MYDHVSIVFFACFHDLYVQDVCGVRVNVLVYVINDQVCGVNGLGVYPDFRKWERSLPTVPGIRFAIGRKGRATIHPLYFSTPFAAAASIYL